MKIGFISDLHLSSNTLKSNALFCDLLKKLANEVDELYILGDLFDVWLGDDDQNEFTNQIQSALLNFSQKKPLFFMHGNHDYLIGKKFCHLTGAKLIQDLSTITKSDSTILLSHGDAFCTFNINYQRFKKFYNNRVIKFILVNISLKARQKILDYYLKKIVDKPQKKTVTKSKDPLKYKINPTTIIKLAKAKNATVIIHGHTHNPNIETLYCDGASYTRIEIPDWKNHNPGGYVLLDAGKFYLKSANQ